MNYAKLSDEKVLEICEHFGTQARHWRTKFLGILPEIFRRKLFIKKGCSSVFEFAYKTGGVSEKQVRKALNLEKKFVVTPVLRQALVNGEISLNKLARVASIATVETQNFWLEKSKTLSSRALEVLVRDEKTLMKNEQQIATTTKKAVAFGSGKISANGNTTIFANEEIENTSSGNIFDNEKSAIFNPEKKVANQGDGSQIGLFEAENKAKSVHVHTLKLDPDVETKLQNLQEKGFDINELLRELLANREKEIAAEKQALANATENEISVQRHTKRTKLYETLTFQVQYFGKNLRAMKELPQAAKPKKVSRSIPTQIKKIVTQEHGTKCAIPTCQKLSEHIHHTNRFSLSQSHNPYFLAPLCKQHHEIAHSVDLKYHEKRGT